MSWLGRVVSKVMPKNASQSDGGGTQYSLNAPKLLEVIGRAVNGTGDLSALQNGAVNRAFRLNCETIGMLPLHLMWRDEKKGKATGHPVYRVLHRKPNNWQTPYEFKRLMMAQLLRHGVGYAQIIRSGSRVIALQPLAKFRVVARQNNDWSITYELTNANGVKHTLQQSEIFALRDMDMDSGVTGASRLEQAFDAISMSASVRAAAKSLFDNGMKLGGVVEQDGAASEETKAALREELQNFKGSTNAGKWLIVRKAVVKQFEGKLADNSQVENLSAQIEEIARIFGVPRPLMMMDETSWGSGIEELGRFFVQYGLAPQFANWEQSIGRDLLSESELDEYQPKFNDGALLRGSLQAQADFFAKALGNQPWMKVNEARAKQDLPAEPGFDEIKPASNATKGQQNDPPKPA